MRRVFLFTLLAPLSALACPPSVPASVVIEFNDLPECVDVQGGFGDALGGDPFLRIHNDCGEAIQLIDLVPAGETWDVPIESPPEGVSERTEAWAIGDRMGTIELEVRSAQIVPCDSSGCATASGPRSLGALLAVWAVTLRRRRR